MTATALTSSRWMFVRYATGLLLYNGESDDGRGGDFLSLGMSGGALEFRFDTGAGPAIIRSAPLALDEWHVARVKRLQNNGQCAARACVRAGRH